MQIETEKAMNSRYRSPLILLVGVWLLCACSATRDLPDDTYMLSKVKVVTDGKYKDINPTQMKTYVRQKTNSRWLSTMKVPLGIYALAGKDSSWVNRTLRQLGEAPVTYDTLMAQQTCKDLQLALQNKGYLDAEVELYVDIKKRKLDAIYVLHPGTAYHVHGLDIDIRDSVIANLLKDYKNVLHDGMQFSTDALNTERSQITQFLQNHTCVNLRLRIQFQSSLHSNHFPPRSSWSMSSDWTVGIRLTATGLLKAYLLRNWQVCPRCQ